MDRLILPHIKFKYNRNNVIRFQGYRIHLFLWLIIIF